jgi:hypothetical protein
MPSKFALALVAALCPAYSLFAQPASSPAEPDPLILRFEVKGNEIYDRKTDLTWQRCNYGQTWDEQQGWCKGVTKRFTVDRAVTHVNENAKDWRVPELGELMSIMEARCPSLQVKTGIVLIFPEFSRDEYYLSITPHGVPENAMAAKCLGNRADNFGLSRKYVSILRLVRSGR